MIPFHILLYDYLSPLSFDFTLMPDLLAGDVIMVDLRTQDHPYYV